MAVLRVHCSVCADPAEFRVERMTDHQVSRACTTHLGWLIRDMQLTDGRWTQCIVTVIPTPTPTP